METRPTQNTAETFGIIDTKPLDASYLDTLFGTDTEEAEPITIDTKEEAPPTQPKGPKEEKKQPAPKTFIDRETDFIEGLQDEAGATNPKTPEEPDSPTGPAETAKVTTPPPDTPIATTQLQDNIAAFTRELFETGILESDEQEPEVQITTPQELINRFEHEKKKGAIQLLEGILSNYGPDYREAFQAIYINGVRPRDYFGQLESVTHLADMDMSRAENQKLVLSRHYKDLGWDNAKITAKIEKLENYQDLEEEARDIHTALVQKEKQALAAAEQARKIELDRKLAIQQEHHVGVQQILKERLKSREFDGIPLDEKQVRQLQSYMLEKRWQLAEEQITDFDKDLLDLARPENRELQVKIALLMQMLKIDPTLSRLQKKAITKESDSLFSFLQRDQRTQKRDTPKAHKFFED